MDGCIPAVADPAWEPGRVVAEHRGSLRVATASSERSAEIAGRLRFAADSRHDLPVTGDWVAIDGPVVRAVVDRRSRFARRDPGGGEQLLAANVDVAFVVTSLNRDFNLRRLERYLAMIWSSGARPVVLLGKADLAPDRDERLAEVAQVAVGATTIAVSVPLALGIDEVRRQLPPRATAAFLGSSGVGKSTLINALAGQPVMAIGDVREADDRGRHTTTHRQLLTLPGGWLVIDTPGLRELGLTDESAAGGLDRTFADVDDLATECRFADCRHASEPGCAVRTAIADGRLGADRLASRRKLEREVARTTRATDPIARAEHRRYWRAIHRSVNDHMNRKYGDDR